MRFAYEYMYKGIHLTRNKWTIYFWPIFMWRKYIYIMIPCVFINYPNFQIQFIILTHSIYVIWYTNIRPHIEKSKYYLEIFNEVMIMIMLYIMILYSKFNTNPISYFWFGYSYIGALGLLLIVNISLMFYNII